MKRPGQTFLLHAALVAGAVVTVTPLAWMISASLMPQGEANTFPPRLFPSRPTLSHYQELVARS